MSPETPRAPAVELRDISKRFGTVLANDRVTFCVSPATIHGIIGENGAGKSTAMNLIYGLHRPDSGELWIEGTKSNWRSPSDAIAAGIGMVHQHFLLAGPHTALDNIVLGAEPTRHGFFDRRAARNRLDALMNQYGLHLELEQPVEQLAVGTQQKIEILKLLYRGARILILDEPTAVLTPQESVELFRNLRKLRDEGKTILVITHKLQEVLSSTERITVMRAGKVVGELNTAETNAQDLADLMVGRKVNLNLKVPDANPKAETALEVQGLTLDAGPGNQKRLDGVTFNVRCGEIVGVAGVEGNGQSELVRALLLPREKRFRTEGRVTILGSEVSGWPARRIRSLGVALIPEDRQLEGLLLDRSLVENFALGLYTNPEFNYGGFVDWKKISTAAETSFATFHIRPGGPKTTARQLSGGNQQKLVVAREFYRPPRLLLASQPTRGVDVGSIELIHETLVQARDSGAGVLLVSSNLDEILTLADRILVMFKGRIVGEFPRHAVTERELGLRMAGIAESKKK